MSLKILLLGEFSGLHKNLQAGLRAAGHQVDLVSGGDSFKAIFGNIIPPRPRSNTPLHKLQYHFDYYFFLKRFSGYDVVQLINVNAFPQNWFPYKKALNYLKQNNGKVFLLAAGSDAFYWQRARPLMRYGPYEDVLKYDSKSSSISFQTPQAFEFNRHIAVSVDGVIPIAYEYALAYQGLANRRPAIPLPIDLSVIEFKPNEINQKLTVFHGLNRYGFKGTRHIEKAFESLSKSHGKVLCCEIKGRLPLVEYLKKIEAANIIVDQVNSYSYGMNAIYSAALGKVVLSGSEPECLTTLNLKNCPIINTLPDNKDVELNILKVLEGEIDLAAQSAASRKFVESVHCCHLISARYIEEWRR